LSTLASWEDKKFEPQGREMNLNSQTYPCIGGGGVSLGWVLLFQHLPARYCRTIQF
jgi:hypothetical protein